MSTAPVAVPGPPATVRTVVLPPALADRPLLSLVPRGVPATTWVTSSEDGPAPAGDPAAETGMVGWGEAARAEFDGAERFSRAQRWWAGWLADADVDDPLSLPGTGPVAFMSFAFDAVPGRSVAVVPRVVVGRRDGASWLTVVAASPREARLAVDETLAALHHPVAVPEAPEGIAYAEGSLTVPEWQSAVAEAVRRIDAGELDKVVLARDVVVTADGPIDPRFLLTRLAGRYPSCWTFSVDGLLGSTPEMLVQRIGSSVTSRVLAGTMRRSRDADRDDSLASALLGSAKDHAEHEYAVRSVALALAAHCTDLDVPGTPSLLRLANVQHLATDVRGVLADGSPVLALAASLHPTAAVCGTPTERASAVIRELEGMDRGRYAGPVGWVDARGDGEFGIALRCGAVEAEDRLRLFAGCGLVTGSDPDVELAESQAKLVAMRDALEPA
ncbi:MAG: isochorismate synthase [Frankiales bacterium]|nr:isochorismate synthase [Frankiales bacterium]